MKTSLALASFVLTAACCSAQQRDLAGWKKLLLEKKDAKATRTLCSSFADSHVLAEQVEAEKCLSNVAIFGADTVRLEKDEHGQAVMYDEYIPAAVDESLQHLNRGIQLAPNDLTIHQGRLHLLEISRRYSEMPAALEESCTLYHGAGVPAAWLDYASELQGLHQYKTGLEFMRILEKHYPDDPDILGNIGAFLSLLEKDKEAIDYLKRAVALAPNDPINAWDLGREYDYAGETGLADQWYQKALQLMIDPDVLKQSRCLYAQFVEKKLKDAARACKLQRDSCEAAQQTACSSVTASEKSQR